MVVVSSLYVLNLLCAMVPCDPQFRAPEIRKVGLGENRTYFTRGGRQLVTKDNANGSPRVTLSFGGQVEGHIMASVSGKEYYAFEGIPYAQPPVGQNRFKPPKPAIPWAGVFMAKKPGSPCLQMNPLALYRTMGREDCLTVNVYSSKLPSSGESKPLLPVMIWLHGGAFMYGDGATYGPAYLLTRDIVLVSLNHRLGVLGFLSTGDAASPGNNGLKDQRLAIQWVYDNIAQFGGDQNRITLIGHSAGAASAHFHMMTNATKHFHAAMSLSGTAFNYWALSTHERALGLTNKLAKRMNCPTVNRDVPESSYATVDCFRKRNPVLLVSNQMNLLDWGPLPVVLFSPVLEAPSEDAFLTETPQNLYAQGKVAKIPWITSVTKEEGYFHLQFIYGFMKTPELRSKWDSLAPILFDYHHNPNNSINEIETTRKIHQYYFKSESPKSQPTSMLSRPFSERFFVKGFHEATLEHSKIAPTYSYIFGHHGKYNVGNFLGLRSNEWGVGHAEDIFYIFNSTKLYTGFGLNEPESKLSQAMVNLFTNFATEREPLYTTEDGHKTSIWNPVDPKNPHFLSFGQKKIEMIKDPYVDIVSFWKSLNFPDE